MIRSWFTHFIDRKLEWLLSLYTFWFGAFLILPYHSMSSASFVGALGIMPEWAWGTLYILTGTAHMIALHINGRAAWTPFARLLALFLNSQVFFALCLSLVAANPMGTGVFTYGFISIAMCGAAGWAAAKDCGREWSIWAAKRRGSE